MPRQDERGKSGGFKYARPGNFGESGNEEDKVKRDCGAATQRKRKGWGEFGGKPKEDGDGDKRICKWDELAAWQWAVDVKDGGEDNALCIPM